MAHTNTNEKQKFAGATYDPLVTPVALAAELELSPATLATWRTRGGGPPFLRVGKAARYRRSDVEKWKASKVATSTSDEPEKPEPLPTRKPKGPKPAVSVKAPAQSAEPAPSATPAPAPAPSTPPSPPTLTDIAARSRAHGGSD